MLADDAAGWSLLDSAAAAADEPDDHEQEQQEQQPRRQSADKHDDEPDDCDEYEDSNECHAGDIPNHAGSNRLLTRRAIGGLVAEVGVSADQYPDDVGDQSEDGEHNDRAHHVVVLVPLPARAWRWVDGNRHRSPRAAIRWLLDTSDE
jgi:hypothetical protein